MSHHFIPLLAGFVGGSMVLVFLQPRAVRVLIADARDIYNNDDKRERLTTFILIGLIWAMCAALAISAANILARLIPIEQRINHIQTYQKVVKVKQVVIPVPTDVKYPTLDDPKKVCHGAPGIIVRMSIAGSESGDKDRKYTWLTMRPAGDAYTVACYMDGNNSDTFHEGDLIALVGGKVAGSE
jgi:hypothetical protein